MLAGVLIFDFIPYCCIVGVLIFSIIKITILLKKEQRFTRKNRLFCIAILVCIIYLFNCIHYSFEGDVDFTELNIANRLLAIALFTLHQFTLMIVVFAIYKFTNPNHADDFDRSMSINTTNNTDPVSDKFKDISTRDGSAPDMRHLLATTDDRFRKLTLQSR